MIDAAQRARIRRLFCAAHWRIDTIASELGVHHDTVRLAVEADRFANTGTRIRPTLLDPYKALVGKILDDHPKLRATLSSPRAGSRRSPCAARTLDCRRRARASRTRP